MYIRLCFQTVWPPCHMFPCKELQHRRRMSSSHLLWSWTSQAIRPIKACASIANIWLYVRTLSCFLNSEHQARKQHVPFVKSLVWLGQGSNHWPSRLITEAPTIPPKSPVQHLFSSFYSSFKYTFYLYNISENNTVHFWRGAHEVRCKFLPVQ